MFMKESILVSWRALGFGRAALIAASLAAAACGDDSAGSGGAPATGGAGGVGGTDTGGAGGMVNPWLPLKHLVAVDIGAADPETGILKFEMPENTLGFTLVAESVSKGYRTGIAEMGVVGRPNILEDYGLPTRKERWFLGLDEVAASNPQTDKPDAMPFSSGEWQARLGTEAPDRLVGAKTFVRRTADGQFHGGVLDLNIRMVPGIADEAYMGEVLESLFNDYYKPLVGLDRGEVTTGALDAKFTTIADDDAFRDMLGTSEGIGPAPAANVFVVGSLELFGGALGVSGGIPGTPMHGMMGSGIALTLSGDVDFDSNVLFHELGHLGGLFHPVEFDGLIADALDDTIPGSTTNVMSAAPGLGQLELSPKQVTVLRGSALYRGILQEGGAPGEPLELGSPMPAPSFSTVPIMREKRREAGTRLEAILSSAWCPRTVGLSQVIWQRHGLGHEAELEHLIDDPSAFILARARALTLLARFGSERARAWASNKALTLSADRSIGRPLRLAALNALHPMGGGAVHEVPIALESDSDPLIAHVARSIRELDVHRLERRF